MKKIVIELTKSNKVRKVYTKVPIDLAREAVSNVSAHPSKLKYSRRYRAGKMLKGLKSRFGLHSFSNKDRSKFVELHCKPGDVVYHYCEELHEILDYTVYCINLFRDNGITYNADAYDEENAEALSNIGFEPEDIGRDVFLTRKEAEQALKQTMKLLNSEGIKTRKLFFER